MYDFFLILQAEKHGCHDLADLFWNRAALHTYLQQFEEALNDFAQAGKLDPTLPVGIQVGGACV